MLMALITYVTTNQTAENIANHYKFFIKPLRSSSNQFIIPYLTVIGMTVHGQLCKNDCKICKHTPMVTQNKRYKMIDKVYHVDS